MRTVNRYIGKNLLVSMLLALGVLTFVMFSGHFFQAFELMSKGVSPAVLMRFLGYMVPDILRFTLPLSILVSTVLVFGRMSSDNEISALKSSGISLWQIISPGLLLSLVCSGICVYLSLYLAPLCRYEADRMKWTALESAPITLLEPGVFVDLSDEMRIGIDGREGKDLLGVHLIMRDKDNVLRDVVAARGNLVADFEARQMKIHLENASMTEIAFGKDVLVRRNGMIQKDVRSVPRMSVSAEEIDLPLAYGVGYDQKKLLRKVKYLDLGMLFARVRLAHEQGEDGLSFLYEMHKRLAMSLSPFAFFLLGLPFGIRGRRSELSVGLLICVLLALGFYVFLMIADTLDDNPECHPDIIVWIPNLLYLVCGLFAIRRLSKH